MTQLLIYSCVLFSLLSLGACESEEQPSTGCVNSGNPDTLTFPVTQMKGWEIYSWPGCQDWNYSLLYGTNAVKNYDEVTGRQPSDRLVIKVWGKNKLKTILSRMPAGHTVSLVGENWLSNAWGQGAFKDLQLPPTSVINELQQTATQTGLTFQVLN